MLLVMRMWLVLWRSEDKDEDGKWEVRILGAQWVRARRYDRNIVGSSGAMRMNCSYDQRRDDALGIY